MEPQIHRPYSNYDFRNLGRGKACGLYDKVGAMRDMLQNHFVAVAVHYRDGATRALGCR